MFNITDTLNLLEQKQANSTKGHKNQSSFEWPANQSAKNLNLISQTDKTKMVKKWY
jgi:hypothetical protein